MRSDTWLIIVALGIGTYLIRYSFLGLVGQRPLPPFLLRLLRYTPVAVLPGLVAPLILWPAATGGATDPVRLAAAAATLAAGVLTHNVVLSILSGAATLYAAMAIGALL